MLSRKLLERQILQIFAGGRHHERGSTSLAGTVMGTTSCAKDDQSPETTLPSLSVPHGLHARLHFPLLSSWMDSCIAFSVC